MENINMPDDCAKQWEILLLLLSSEEKKIDRTSESEVDTMTYFYKNKGVRKILTHWLQQMKATYAKKTNDSHTALKCDEVSLLWRQKGNDKFKVNLVEASYKYYTLSVLYAKPNSLMFSLAIANRSASLLRMKRFQECLSDIKMAMSSGYPKEQLYKLYLRRADCHIELQQRTEARASLDAALLNAGFANFSTTFFSEFERHIKKMEKKLLAIDQKEAVVKTITLPECYLGLNPDFAAASNAIELRRADAVGRHVVTKAETHRGDILFSEEPYAWVTLPPDSDAITSYVCEICCKNEVNPVPCTTCSIAIYCSEACRSSAVFHRWECAAAQCDLLKTIGIAHLALRVLLIGTVNGFPTPPTQLPSLCSAAELFKSYAQVDNIKIYDNNTPAFYRMFNLVTNFDKMNNTDYIQYALTSTMLTLYLEQYTDFFEVFSTSLPCLLREDDSRVFAAAVVLRSLGQLVCNGHATLSLSVIARGACGRTISEKEVRRATAIYPSAAMMNHSCDPNIINTFYNRRLIIRCALDLSAGAQVFNCYGPHRARAPAAQRRAQLRAQYMFTCACSACSDSERKDFVVLFGAYACQSCKGPVTWHGRRPSCHHCNADFHPEKALSILDRSEEIDTEAERATTMEARCTGMSAAFRLKQQVWHKHHTTLRAAADRLARNYAAAGEFTKSMELIKQNIQTLEYQFGSFSVEVAHELRKLSDVMLQRILNTPQHSEHRDWCLEAHKVLKKAVQLMDLNYGSWEPLVSRLREQEAFVASLLAETTTPNAPDCIHHNLHYNLKI